MFAVEITFQDGASEPETIFVRRPQALIGASEYAHVMVDDMASLGYQLRLTRDLGRRFSCMAVGAKANSVPSGVEGSFDGEAWIDTGAVKFYIVAMDVDLLMKEGEAPDSAGAQLFRRASSTSLPTYPALMVGGNSPLVVSFAADQPIFVGRSKQCALRLDASDVSAKHARIGFEAGEFWVEDLGSTNGTFVDGQQISGRVSIASNTPITVGREISIIGVTGAEQARQVSVSNMGTEHKALALPRYPALISTSEVARPARLLLTPDSEVHVGRDPSSDMWLGAPHVSRRHFSVRTDKDGSVTVIDGSTNGTGYQGGVLRRGENLSVDKAPQVLDVGSGITVAICFDLEQEKVFVSSNGASSAFVVNQDAPQALSAEQAGEIESSLSLRGRAQQDLAERGGFIGWLRAYFSSRGLLGLVQLVCSLLALMLILYFALSTLIRVLPK